MNVLNEKARILRIQIEVEKSKENPNWSNIQTMKKELQQCIEGLNGN